jgi:hypothetical protein
MGKDKPEHTHTDMDKLFARAKSFEAGGHSYRVLPLLVTDAIEYGELCLWVYDGAHIIGLEEGRVAFSNWLEKAARTMTGEVVTLETVKADGWTTADVQEYLKVLAGASG